MRTKLLAGSILLLTIVVVGYRIINKPHRSVDAEDFLVIEADQLFAAFKDDETKANELYLDNVVQVSGMVSEIMANQDGRQVLLLNGGDDLFGVSCSMEEENKSIRPGMKVTIKGICTGYLSDVVITRGKLVN
jgi:hypothetical protein